MITLIGINVDSPDSQVGGRKCDECLAGFYGFPHCYGCSCEVAGSTEDICDQDSATCLCKVSCSSMQARNFDVSTGSTSRV